MDKLSDKIKSDIRSIDLDNKKNKSINWSAVRETKINLLPEIEKLEQEKEELIKTQIDYCFHECEYCKIDDTFHGDDECKYCPFYQKNITVLEKITHKSWDQITQEQE